MDSKNSAPKRKLELCISDIDNCISDFFGLVSKTSAVVLEDIQKEFNIPREQLIKEVKEVSYNKTHEYYNHNAVKLIEELPCLKGKDEKIKAKIAHKWDKNRRELCELYPSVKDTFKGIREAGGKVVLFSDCPATSGIVRLRLMGIKPEDIDAVYMRKDPSIPGDNRPLFQYDKAEASYAEKMSEKIITIPNKFHKPQPELLSFIAKDMGAREDRTCMIGDTDKDVLCCVGNECISVLQEQGATIDKKTLDVFKELSIIPNYEIGIDAVNKKLKEAGVEPDIRLDGYKNFSKYFEYVPASKTANENNFSHEEKQAKVTKILENKDKHKKESGQKAAVVAAKIKRGGR